jgi:hypothetical protein
MLQPLLGASARRGKERQGEHRSKGTSAATTGNLLGIVVRRGGCNCKEARQRQWGGAKETTPGIQCWLQRLLIPWQWYCLPNNCDRPGIKRGDAIAIITSNGRGGWRGRSLCNSINPGKRLELLRGMLIDPLMASGPYGNSKPAMHQQ